MSDISVHVIVPEGVAGPRATLWFEPDTTEQFETALNALGGILKTSLGCTTGTNPFLSFDVDGGRAYLYFPKDLAPPAPAQTPQSAFTAALKKRQNEARDFMERLEAAAGIIEAAS